jgi:hypothetical protein
MHAVGRWGGRLGLVGLALGGVLGGGGVTRGPDAASAQAECGHRCSYDGRRTAQGYSAMGAYVSAAGPGSVTTPEPCVVGTSPAEPAHIEVDTSEEFGDGEYLVWVGCVVDGAEVGDFDFPGDPNGGWENIGVYAVTAVDPEEVVERALTAVDVPPPRITTSPGGDDPSLVGIETWLMVDSGSWGRIEGTHTEGPVSVHVWADPVDDGRVVWDTGEATITCAGNGLPPGSCPYTYESSSAGQPGTDARGRPAFPISASITYTGGYEVSIFGQPVGGRADLPDITRQSDPVYLAVAEAQALNTWGRRR